MPPPPTPSAKYARSLPPKEQMLLALLGAGFSVILIIGFVPLIKLFILTKLAGVPAALQYGVTLSVTVIESDTPLTFGQALSVVVAQYAAVLLLVEVYFFLIGWAKGRFRVFLLFSQFALTSFFVFSLVFFIVAFVSGWKVNDDWTALFGQTGTGIEQKFITTFAVIFIIFAYLSYLLTRTRVLFADSGEKTNTGKPHEKIRK